MKILALAICNNFWNRLGCVSQSWQDAADRFSDEGHVLDFCVGTVQEQPAEIKARCMSIQQMHPSTHLINGITSKPSMLHEMYRTRLNTSYTHILFTDCDIIFPNDFGPQSIGCNDIYQVAERVDLNHIETSACIGGARAGADYSDINHSKTGMGWFQLIRREAFSYATRGYTWKHDGYDVFDWELNRDLSRIAPPRTVQCSPFFHLWHGDSGSTWKGTSEQY